MDEQKIQQWIGAFAALVSGGFATVRQVKAIIALLSPEMSDDEMNAVIEGIIANSTRRQQLAKDDAAAARAEANGDPT